MSYGVDGEHRSGRTINRQWVEERLEVVRAQKAEAEERQAALYEELVALDARLAEMESQATDPEALEKIAAMRAEVAAGLEKKR